MPRPFDNIITVFNETPFVRLCIMLFIVGKGTPLSWDSLYCEIFRSSRYLHNLSATTLFIVFILNILIYQIYKIGRRIILWVDISSYMC